mgnify:CR=1 FL=1
MVYSIGDVLLSKNILNDKTAFYVVSGKFINQFGDLVYNIETLVDDAYGPVKFNEISKFIEGWLTKVEDIDII